MAWCCHTFCTFFPVCLEILDLSPLYYFFFFFSPSLLSPKFEKSIILIFIPKQLTDSGFFFGIQLFLFF
ncbi:hypothetical protein J3F83DRAFT_755942, partial [Trichoderma novae-zelandiae]